MKKGKSPSANFDLSANLCFHHRISATFPARKKILRSGVRRDRIFEVVASLPTFQYSVAFPSTVNMLFDSVLSYSCIQTQPYSSSSTDSSTVFANYYLRMSGVAQTPETA